MNLNSLDRLVKLAAVKGRRKLVVAVAQDEDVLKAVRSAVQGELIIPILIGNKEEIKRAAGDAEFNLSGIEVIHESDRNAACIRAVKLVKEEKAEILMKGIGEYRATGKSHY